VTVFGVEQVKIANVAAFGGLLKDSRQNPDHWDMTAPLLLDVAGLSARAGGRRAQGPAAPPQAAP
jgi:hypothetical protein